MDKPNLAGFPVTDFINDGDGVWITVDSPDGDFILVINKDGSAVLEVFSPQHVVHRGRVYQP